MGAEPAPHRARHRRLAVWGLRFWFGGWRFLFVAFGGSLGGGGGKGGDRDGVPAVSGRVSFSEPEGALLQTDMEAPRTPWKTWFHLQRPSGSFHVSLRECRFGPDETGPEMANQALVAGAREPLGAPSESQALSHSCAEGRARMLSLVNHTPRETSEPVFLAPGLRQTWSGFHILPNLPVLNITFWSNAE